MLLQLPIALGDPLLIGVVHLHFLLQHKQQFRTPVTLQAFSNLLGTGRNSRITESLFHALSVSIAVTLYIADLIQMDY
jgi:hypothetical protein